MLLRLSDRAARSGAGGAARRRGPEADQGRLPHDPLRTGRAVRRARAQGRPDVRGRDQRQGRRARPQDRAAAARHQGQRRRGGARLARADPEGERRLPRRHAHLGGGPGGLGRRQGEQDRLHRADPEDRPAHRRRQAPSLRLPRGREHHHGRAQRRRDRGQVAGDQDRHDQPRLRLWPGRDQVVRRAPEEDQAERRDRRPAVAEARRGRTTRRSSTRRWPRSPTRCSRRSGAATSSPSPSRPSRSATSTPSSTTSSAWARRARRSPPSRMGKDYPVGIWGNSYDAFYWGDTARPQGLHRAAREVPEGRVPVVVGDPGLHRRCSSSPRRIKKANSTDSDKVSKALLGLTIDTPHRQA